MLKKSMCIFVLLAFFFTMSIHNPKAEVDAAGDNLIQNYGFEDSGNWFNGWIMEGCGATRIETEKHSGSYGAKVYSRTQFGNSLRYGVTIENNVPYVCSMWLKLPAGESPQEFKMLTDPNWIQIEPKAVVTSSDWIQLSGVYVCPGPEGGTTTVYLRVSQVSGSTCVDTYYTDDWSVVKSVLTTSAITGSDKIGIPEEGRETERVYTVTASDQGGHEREGTTVWYVTDSVTGLAPNGVNVSGNGVLKITDEAVPGDIILHTQTTFAGITVNAEKTVTLGRSLAPFAADAITTGTITNEPPNAITGNLTLPQTGEAGTSITWRSDEPKIISVDGEVRAASDDRIVTLTATVSDAFSTVNKAINLVVKGQENRFNNGGFEGNNNGDWIAEDCIATRVTEEAFAGQYAMKVSGRTAFSNTIRQSVTVQNNVPYICSLWMKLPEGAAPQEFIMLTDPNWIVIGESALVTDGEWTELRGNYVCPGPDGGSTTVYLRVSQMTGDILNSYYTDNWSIQEAKGETTFGNTYFYGAGSDITNPADDELRMLGYTTGGMVSSNTLIETGVNPVEVCMLTALYENGILQEVKSLEVTVGAYAQQNFYSVMEGTNENSKVKVMFLDNLNSMTPIRQEAILKNAYYVTPNGNDAGSGSFENPFQTIQHAADIMEAGDTCVVRGGTYRETVIPQTSGSQDKPITFTTYRNEQVILSGADEVESVWQQDSGQIYKANYGRKVTQLFVNGKMMNIARWPNAKVDRIMDAESFAVTDAADYGYVSCAKLPYGNFNGAKLYIWSGLAWNGFEREVLHTTGEKQLNFTVPFPVQSNGLDVGDPWRPFGGNKFYIYGTRNLLDIPTEWVQDKQDNSLYLWNGQGRNPEEDLVEVKARDWAFDVTGKDHIRIEGFQIFAAAIRLKTTNNSIIDNCYVVYPSDDNRKSMYIDGAGNAVKNSYIAHTPGDGITLLGTNNLIYNNVIHDINTCGDHFAAVQTNGLLNRIEYNTFYNAGRSLILHYYSRKLLISHNHLYLGGLLSKDLGATYSWGNNDGLGSQGSEISYNWIHDMGEETGIYLDSYSTDYTVHHNVVYNVRTAFVLNGGALNDLVYNNTAFNHIVGFFTTTFEGYVLTQKGTKIKNNIVSGIMMFAEGENAPEVSHNADVPVSENYLPAENSAAIDAGVVIDGITDGYVGNAPDIGAYEVGGRYWTAGAGWKTLLQ